jgi:signal transduction histidine kinase
MRGADSKFKAEFELDLGEDVGELSVVSQNIGRVFLNVINNAFYAVDVRAKAENRNFEPIVRVKSRRTDRHVEISIEDNGDGIPPELVDKVFEPFFTTKPTGSGTGLGLSLAYDIVTEEHGGEMTLQTEVGKGTTFLIKLPITGSSD